MRDCLILVPTPAERDALRLSPAEAQTGLSHAGGRSGARFRIEVCGFGAVASAARTSQLIARHRPARVILAGIAGTYQNRLPAGTAAMFTEVVCYGIGAGSGADHVSASAMGWRQWESSGDQAVLDSFSSRSIPSDASESSGSSALSQSRAGQSPDASAETPASEAPATERPEPEASATEPPADTEAPETELTIADRLAVGSAGDRAEVTQRCLLTCCSASANEEDVRLRLEAYPDAVAEDMEGFAVAAACALAGVPLDIVRGISNRAGDRDKANWKINQALQAAAHLTRQILHGADQ